MPDRAFPVVHAKVVTQSACFYEALGFEEEVRQLTGAGVKVLREPEQMPWGERVAYVAGPDGNPVALADAGLV